MKGEAERSSPVFTWMCSPRVAGRDGHEQRTNRTNSRSEEAGNRGKEVRLLEQQPQTCLCLPGTQGVVPAQLGSSDQLPEPHVVPVHLPPLLT